MNKILIPSFVVLLAVVLPSFATAGSYNWVTPSSITASSLPYMSGKCASSTYFMYNFTIYPNGTITTLCTNTAIFARYTMGANMVLLNYNITGNGTTSQLNVSNIIARNNLTANLINVVNLYSTNIYSNKSVFNYTNITYTLNVGEIVTTGNTPLYMTNTVWEEEYLSYAQLLPNEVMFSNFCVHINVDGDREYYGVGGYCLGSYEEEAFFGNLIQPYDVVEGGTESIHPHIHLAGISSTPRDTCVSSWILEYAFADVDTSFASTKTATCSEDIGATFTTHEVVTCESIDSLHADAILNFRLYRNEEDGCSEKVIFLGIGFEMERNTLGYSEAIYG